MIADFQRVIQMIFNTCSTNFYIFGFSVSYTSILIFTVLATLLIRFIVFVFRG